MDSVSLVRISAEAAYNNLALIHLGKGAYGHFPLKNHFLYDQQS